MIGKSTTVRPYAEARQNMVDNQLRANTIVDEGLIEAMGRIPRERFVPEALAGIAYVDEDLALGHGRFMAEPMVLARLIQAAGVKRGDMVLDVGCATGYSSAVLASLGASVVALESDPRLADQARANLAALGLSGVVVETGDLALGFGARAPYNAILIAGRIERIPQALIAQLAPGGRLATVFAGRGQVGRGVLVHQGSLARVSLFDAASHLVPGFAAEPGFVF
ncbi:MAG: protein-L-isoaspartate O-methyltransferase [Alphaproteobacteria bacterium]|nr:protein-L-isoaspartate O-methyltransferase [Alphaproteobacteria bacterium]